MESSKKEKKNITKKRKRENKDKMDMDDNEIKNNEEEEYESVSSSSEDEVYEEVEESFEEEEEKNNNNNNTITSSANNNNNKVLVNIWDEKNKNNLKVNEELDFDNNAYEMLHRSKVEWPCLSIDFLIPENFSNKNIKNFYLKNSERKFTMDKYPYTTYMIAGSQTNEKINYLYYMKWYNMYKTKYDDDPEKALDSDDEEASNPFMKFEKYKIKGNINRVKTMKNSFITAIYTDLPSIEIIDLSELIKNLENEKDNKSIETEDNNFFSKTNNKKNKKDNKNIIVKSFPQKFEGFALDWNNINPFILASGGYENKINIFIPKDENCSDMLEYDLYSNTNNKFHKYTHSNSIEDIQWSPNQENVLCSCSIDKSIKFWDIKSDNIPIIIPDAHESDINCISWNKLRPNLIASGGDDCIFKVWDIRFIKDGPITNIKWHKGPINSIMWDPNDDSQLAVTSEDDRLSIWDFSVEPDDKKMFDNFNNEIPQQLVFLHQGQNNLKEVKFHPYFKDMLVSTSENGINLFKPGFNEDVNDDDLNDEGDGNERENEMEIE